MRRDHARGQRLGTYTKREARSKKPLAPGFFGVWLSGFRGYRSRNSSYSFTRIGSAARWPALSAGMMFASASTF